MIQAKGSHKTGAFQAKYYCLSGDGAYRFTEGMPTLAGGLSPLSPASLTPARCAQLLLIHFQWRTQVERERGNEQASLTPRTVNALEAGVPLPQRRWLPSGHSTLGVFRPPPPASLLSAGDGRLHSLSPAPHQRAPARGTQHLYGTFLLCPICFKSGVL